MTRLSRQQLVEKVSELEAKGKEIIADFELVKNEHKNSTDKLTQEWETKLKTSKDEDGIKITGLENQIEILTEEVNKKQKQLDEKESKKLAQAYEQQESIYKTGSEKWLKWLMWVGIALVVSTAISVYLSSDEKWYDKFEYYLIDFIFLSAVWFCGSQYSDQVKLRNDYANRKTIAQSFNNILNNLPEDEPIKSKFIEKATDVLCAPSPVSGKEPVLSKKVMKDTAEILSSFKG